MRRIAAYTVLLIFSVVCAYAADSITVATTVDTVSANVALAELSSLMSDTDVVTLDTLSLMKDVEAEQKHLERLRRINRIPKPEMAAWIAAIFPGAGQIYNRQYWKLPIVYGGFAGLGYAISWNNELYVEYRKGYTDLCSSDPNADYYKYLLPSGVEITSSNIDYYKRTFKSKMEGYQRNRDLSILATVVLYMLSIIDSYVDSQLRDYDVSPDLSMHLSPAVIPATKDRAIDNSVGVSCRLKF